ncbi:uncharacterized protein [Argopecten irradians]|uniref:uncharacterized protein n=1 Tax=Argopecten irradians TaxID=31199 RepID=UPI0037163423
MNSDRDKIWMLQFLMFGVLATFPRGVYSSYNIAEGKPASQSTTLSTWTADKAVDGVIGKDVTDGSCSSTVDHGYNLAWWSVNLEETSRIKTINVTYREQYPFRLSGFYLYVSNSSAKYSQPSSWHLCYHDDIMDPDILPSINQLRPCTVDGRYVIFYNKRPADNGPKNHQYYSTYDVNVELCEVQVYGCPVNTFGPTCSTTCHCGVGGCDPDTGLCDVTGCQPGWKGPSCSTGCGTGMFGENCWKKCHCAVPGCDRFSGTCGQAGCAVGYQGNACDQEYLNIM